MEIQREKMFCIDKAKIISGLIANALNFLPGDYDRKVEIQWIWWRRVQTVEYVVQIDYPRKILPIL